MNTVKVLIPGYAKDNGNGSWLVSSTTTLIMAGNGKKIIVDPGINRKRLLKKLGGEGLRFDDVDCVFMTHYHPDHNFLAGIFEKAETLDDGMIYKADSQEEHQGVIPGTDIKIIKTPGHESFHASLLVPTKEGIIAVAGDVFWWADGEKQLTNNKSLLAHKDPFVKDEAVLLESRKKLLKLADYIIPGHGKMFKVEK